MSARVLVMGAGGVGAYFGAALQAGGHDVWYVARGPNLDALRTSGLRVTGNCGSFSLGDVRATDDASEAGERDLVLFCVKNYDLDAGADAIESYAGLVLTLQNGVDAPYRLRERLGDRVLAGSTGIVCDLAGPGHVDVISDYAWIRFGEPDGGSSARSEEVAGWLRAAGSERIQVEPRTDMPVALWEKMALMCAMAGLTSLYRAPMGAILSDPQGLATFRRIVQECEAVARAGGVDLPPDFVDGRMAYASGIDPGATSSLSRDLARGRRAEIDTFNGSVVRIGAERGVAVPLNEAVYAGQRLFAAGHSLPS